MESVKQRIAHIEDLNARGVGTKVQQQQFELSCLRELVAVTEQRDALVAENVALKGNINKLENWPGLEFYSSAWEFHNCDGFDASELICDIKTPATDAARASLRAEGVEMLASEIRKNASHKPETSTAHALLTAQATFAEDFARQLRESKGANHE